MRSNGKRQESAVAFKLGYRELLQRTAGWIQGENILQYARARGRRERRLASKAWHRCPALRRQSAKNRLLVALGTKNIAVGQERKGRLFVLQQAFIRHEHEGPVLLEREADGPAKLLAVQ